MVPDYLWIGRGLAFNQIDAQSASVLASDAGTQYVFLTAVHLYHNGPLWLILDLGLAGFVSGLLLMMSGIAYYGRQLRRIPMGVRWSRAYIVFYSLFVGECIFFLSVFGAGKTFCVIIILASILEVIVRSAEAERSSVEINK
jgi:4-amino-4-deoxy-L-arabinose transferase-like glycosyltransferase